MGKRLMILGALLCCLFLFPIHALATEGAEDEFVGPTRDPNAAEYDMDTPDQLMPNQIVAHSFILMERKTGNILMERNSEQPMFPASTTKIMTALIALQSGIDLSETMTISANAVTLPEDASRVPFKQDEEVTLLDALYGLMLRSGNEAATAIAEFISGDSYSFVQQMNEVAQMLGCTATNFTNPHGYHDELHQSSASDLAKIMNAALDNDTFRQIIATENYELSPTEKNPARNIVNSNLHIRLGDNYYYEFSIGGKTGFTNNAGYVLVEAAQKDGVELIAVAMFSGKYSRWPDTSRLFQYGFTRYKSVTPEEIYAANPTTLQIVGFAIEDRNVGRLPLSLKAVDPTRNVRFTDTIEQIDAIMANFSDYTNINWTVEPRAPVTSGQVMGTLTFYPPPPDDTPAEYQLIATRSIAARADTPLTLEEIEKLVEDDPSPLPPFSWNWVLPPIIGVVGIVFVLRFLIKRLWRNRRRRRKLPKSKKRTFG